MKIIMIIKMEIKMASLLIFLIMINLCNNQIIKIFNSKIKNNSKIQINNIFNSNKIINQIIIIINNNNIILIFLNFNNNNINNL